MCVTLNKPLLHQMTLLKAYDRIYDMTTRKQIFDPYHDKGAHHTLNAPIASNVKEKITK